MSKALHRARLLDHAVLSVSDIAEARERLSLLGFTVAADARHPFGTENACVYFADGTYLEPLGVASREECEETARGGNVFTARDQAFRFRHGQEGLSALAFKTDNAEEDKSLFDAAGFSAGRILQFSRPFMKPDGSSQDATFKLAFAADLRAPDFYGFTCERINLPVSDRSALTAHANGVTGISRIVLSESNPSDFQYFLEEVTGQRDVRATSFGIEADCGNARIVAMTPDGLALFYGLKFCTHSRGLRGRAVVFETASLGALAKLLQEHGIGYEEREYHIAVPAVEGQAAPFIFEEKA